MDGGVLMLIPTTDTPILYTLEINNGVISDTLKLPDKLATALPVYYDTDANSYLGKLPAAKFPPLPEVGWLEQGAIYSYSGSLVMVRQSHNRTIYAPADTPALFVVYRAGAGGTLDWIAGEQVSVGALRIYNGTTYRCLQAHVTQVDWTPPAAPALWAVYIAPVGMAWTVGTAYSVGDLVTYNGATYKCLQAHTSQAGWTPSAVPALWQKQ